MDFPIVAGALGVLAFFGGLALIELASSRSKNQKRQLEHAERMKALELGRALPDADIAWAQADWSRATAAGSIGTLVPLGLIGSAVGGTALVFSYTNDPIWRVVLAGIIWGVCGLVSLVTAACALGVLRRRPIVPTGVPAHVASNPATDSSDAIRERVAPV